ncbi:MAG TPA: hypothetical protein VMI93_14750 [Candidatus Solibacter sp.]|nr:hypothetical protein [Candidatus Solibacter sp.]
MKFSRMVAMLAAAALLSAPAGAQQKSSEAAAAAPNAYRVQVVISEFDGAAKLSSLPYTIPVAELTGESRTVGSVRVGIRVPVSTSSKSGENSIQYVDVGSNLDVRVKRGNPEHYELELTLERSWLYVRDQNKDGKTEGRQWAPGDPAPSLAPLLHHFRTVMEFALRDGRPGETAVTTDPVTGHVLKVDVVLTVLK